MNLTHAEREALFAAILDHQREVLDYGTREACSCGEYRWSAQHAMAAALAVIEPLVAAREQDAAAQALRGAADLLVAECSSIAAPCFCSAAPWLRDRAAAVDVASSQLECPSGCGRNEPCADRWHDRQASPAAPSQPEGLHACVGCGLELDADDRGDKCEDCDE